MATYKFRGRDRGGRLINGELQADNSSAAAAQLIHSGVTPVRIEPAAGEGVGSQPLQLRLFAPKPTLADLMLFARQMYALTKAGIPIVRALKGLAESARNPAMVTALHDVIDSLNAGRDLAGSGQTGGGVATGPGRLGDRGARHDSRDADPRPRTIRWAAWEPGAPGS